MNTRRGGTFTTLSIIAVAAFAPLALGDEDHEPQTTMPTRAAEPGRSAARPAPVARGGGERSAATARDAQSTQAQHGGGTFAANIEQLARSNSSFRRVVHTGPRSQIALMSLPPGSDIGAETHAHVEQLFVIVSGQGMANVGGAETPIGPGSLVVAPPGARHDITASGNEPLRLYTVYSPPNHIDGRVHATKQDAERDTADEAFARRVR